MSQVLWNAPANVMGHQVMAALYSDVREWVCVLGDGVNTFDSDEFIIAQVWYVDGTEKIRLIGKVTGLIPAILRAQEEM